MRRFFFAVLGLASCAAAQTIQQDHPNPDCQFFFNLTTSGQVAPPSPGYDNRQNGCITWSVSYTDSGFNPISIALQSAANNNGAPGAYATGFPVQQTVVTGSNPATNTTAGFAQIIGTNAWVRVVMTGTGPGTVSGSVYGWRIPNAGDTGSPIGPCGGDLGGSFPNCTVIGTNGAALPVSAPLVGTNASGQIVPQVVMTALGDTIAGGASGAPARIPGNTTTGLMFLSQTGNGSASALPSWQTAPTGVIASTFSQGDMICAKGSDTTVNAATITGATNAAPVVFTAASGLFQYVPGTPFTVVGASPAAYNGSYISTASSGGTSLSGNNGVAPGSAWVSGGMIYMPCNNSSDAAGLATAFAGVVSIPGGTFGVNTLVEGNAQFSIYQRNAAIPFATQTSLTYGPGSQIIVDALSEALSAATGQTNYSSAMQFSIFSPAANLLVPTVNSFGGFAVNMQGGNFPISTSTAAAQNVAVRVNIPVGGLKSGTYTSGGSITGTAGQTCTLGTFNNIGAGNQAAATVALTGLNVIAGGTALVVTDTGNSFTTNPTSATLTNGTAICSGTATISTAIGGAQGYAIKQWSLTVKTP